MRTTLESDGRIRIPQEILDLLSLEDGDEFDVELSHGEIIATPRRDESTVDGLRQSRLDQQTTYR